MHRVAFYLNFLLYKVSQDFFVESWRKNRGGKIKSRFSILLNDLYIEGYNVKQNAELVSKTYLVSLLLFFSFSYLTAFDVAGTHS